MPSTRHDLCEKPLFFLFAGLKIHSVSSSFCFVCRTCNNITSSISALICNSELMISNECVLCPGLNPAKFVRQRPNAYKTWKWIAYWFGDTNSCLSDFDVPVHADWRLVCPDCQGDNWQSGEYELKDFTDISSHPSAYNPFKLSLEAWRQKIANAFYHRHGRNLPEDKALKLQVWVSNQKVQPSDDSEEM